MAKSKLNEFKRFIHEMDEKALREEMLKLYNKFSVVKDFYTQDLMTEEERQKILQTYKDKIYKQFWTPKGNPKTKPSNAQIRTLIAEFEKIAVFPYDVIDLLLYRVEVLTDYANQFGGTIDSEYNASITAFKKAIKLMKENELKSQFEARCKKVFAHNNLDFWYIEELEYIFKEN